MLCQQKYHASKILYIPFRARINFFSLTYFTQKCAWTYNLCSWLLHAFYAADFFHPTWFIPGNFVPLYAPTDAFATFCFMLCIIFSRIERNSYNKYFQIAYITLYIYSYVDVLSWTKDGYWYIYWFRVILTLLPAVTVTKFMASTRVHLP